ncbi:Increased DNA methylation 3 [Quillaja saponaria]|uniref:Increased DNA methylation 3 n=1 Tax=Quillaja saponaria TaxID=32244 RepID=A0AAD7PU79_QUISA|nr:Increased DNA methylation 3 [Quillaja saponaria]
MDSNGKHDYDRRFSAFQRLAEGFPPYTLSDLGPSYVSISLLERLYYYVLRDAHPHLVLKPNILHMYLKGNFPLPSSGLIEDSRQFTSFFPFKLHEQIWYPEGFRIIKGIVLIGDPVTSNNTEDEIQRFRSLSNVISLKIDMDKFLCLQFDHYAGNDSAYNCLDKGRETIITDIFSGDPPSGGFQRTYKRRCLRYPPPISPVPYVFPTAKHQGNGGAFKRMRKSDGPIVMPRHSIPDIDDCDLDASVLLTGTARRGLFGPPVGVVDIGISKAAYLFRVALPGVKKDSSGQFSCEIESNGKVHIQGLTTGGRTIRKRSRVFNIKSQQLCSPGRFALSFSLPGPVDPRLCAPKF